MPRATYTPKNRYMHNTNVSEEDIETLALLYVQGASAPVVQDFYELEFGNERSPPSTKTINRIFQMLGHWMFDHVVKPKLPNVQNFGIYFPELEEKTFDELARTMVDFSLSNLDYGTWKNLHGSNPIYAVYDQIPAEVRAIYKARKGLHSDPRAVIGLAGFRGMMKSHYEGKLPWPQIVAIMRRTLLDGLEHFPLSAPKPETKTASSSTPQDIAGDVPEKISTELAYLFAQHSQDNPRPMVVGRDVPTKLAGLIASIYLLPISVEHALTVVEEADPNSKAKISLACLQRIFNHIDKSLAPKLLQPALPEPVDVDAGFRGQEIEFYEQVAEAMLTISRSEIGNQDASLMTLNGINVVLAKELLDEIREIDLQHI